MKQMIKRVLVLFGIVLALFLIQTAILPRIPYLVSVPNLMLIATFAFGFLRGRVEGMIVGVLSGLLMDVFHGGVIGFYTLIFLYIGYMNGILAKYLVSDVILLPMGLCLINEIFYSGYVYVFGFLIRNRVDFGSYFHSVIMPEFLLTVLATVIVYGLILLINRWLERDEKKGATKFA